MWARQLDCSVTEMDVVVCSLGKLSAPSTWIHAVQERKAKWMNINLHRSRLLYGFVDCFNLSTTSALEKHTSQKLCHFWHCCWDSEAILSKNVSSRSPGLNCSYRKISITTTEISVAKAEISVTEVARLLIWRNWIFFSPKKRAAMRDLGNRASSVDRAHMKRSPSSNTCRLHSSVTRASHRYSRRSRVRIPLKPWLFFRLLLSKCLNWKI